MVGDLLSFVDLLKKVNKVMVLLISVLIKTGGK